MAINDPLKQSRVIIDTAANLNGLGGYIRGWALNNAGADDLFIADNLGNKKSLLRQAIRFERPDVTASLDSQYLPYSHNAGFMLYWPWPIPDDAQLYVIASKGEHMCVLAKQGWTHQPLGSVMETARQLFDVPCNWPELREQIGAREQDWLDRLLQQHHAFMEQQPVVSWQYGTLPPAPAASVIVPLYGRYDFAHNQLLELSKDRDFMANAELIYVLDDPALLDSFQRFAVDYQPLYGQPFTVVWGGCNRGFAGACNLGAAQATADTLVFLNSDAIPRQPGWLSQLTGAVQNNPDYGAIGVSLFFADGGIQHIGMQFEYSELFQVWLNQHPFQGLAGEDFAFPEKLLPRPAVTAACLGISKQHFHAVKGFDTGYWIGDFEDSDLCMKLRDAGLEIGYLPQIQMTHLERQSFTALGGGDFRQKVVLVNALRHHNKWADKIPAINHFDGHPS